MIGDSILAWHKPVRASVGDALARETGLGVENRAQSGARVSSTLAKGDIRGQYSAGPWDWVVMNGGANDLLSKCGCGRCDGVMESLVGPEGRGGDLAALVARARGDGARVAILGYYHTSGPNMFRRCKALIDVLNARLARLAARDPGVVFVPARDVIRPDDRSLYYIDGIHPSRRGAAAIGAHLAAALD